MSGIAVPAHRRRHTDAVDSVLIPGMRHEGVEVATVEAIQDVRYLGMIGRQKRTVDIPLIPVPVGDAPFRAVTVSVSRKVAVDKMEWIVCVRPGGNNIGVEIVQVLQIIAVPGRGGILNERLLPECMPPALEVRKR